ncbi:hypothetical protein [Pseudomonas multiresinivorans]|uniref:Uncharacterized protein n=1 Tax=Pseudomonas multiresinivorans TaxID=95301 RepID=A0A7Z3BNM4_9PSED|nr:hypothetical protein [Pseudomonas multiresinivorans]QJP10004.1 hypothetical protein G4G71_19690 [Pseudomonas multiresinivorans]
MTAPHSTSKRPIPFELEEDYLDPPPEGFNQADIEHIWWTVSSRMSKKQIRAWLVQTMDAKSNGHRFKGFLYSSIADEKGRGRYPRGIVTVLRQVLRHRRLMPADHRREASLIEMEVWHFLSTAALALCPNEALPAHLRT